MAAWTVDLQRWKMLAGQAGYDARALARLFDVSPRQLQREFRRVLQRSPQNWLDEQRIAAAGPLLLSGVPLKQIAADLGFKQTSHFCRKFKIQHGLTPTNYILIHFPPPAASSMSLTDNECR